MTDGSLHPDQTVLIQGNRIVAIGPVTTIAVPEGAEIVEAAGGYLIRPFDEIATHDNVLKTGRLHDGDLSISLRAGAGELFSYVAKSIEDHDRWKRGL